ncbi:hypothetical protein D1007_29642 [Hordeum vulgare]|nr:hypothetical protein D1007_29642 [Hordeum vulgare]
MAFEDIFGNLPSPAVNSTSPSSTPATSSPLPPPATASSHTSEIITELQPPPPPPAATPLSIHNDHISNHVKFKLDPAENNYTKWRMFFNLVLLQYCVQDHVTRPPPPNPDADWLAVDQRLMLWIYFTLSDNLLELIMGGAVDGTRIKDYFLANQAPPPSPSSAASARRPIAGIAATAMTAAIVALATAALAAVALAAVATAAAIVAAVVVAKVVAAVAVLTPVAAGPPPHHPHHGRGTLPRMAWPCPPRALDGFLPTPPASSDHAPASTPRRIP